MTSKDQDADRECFRRHKEGGAIGIRSRGRGVELVGEGSARRDGASPVVLGGYSKQWDTGVDGTPIRRSDGSIVATVVLGVVFEFEPGCKRRVHFVVSFVSA